MSNPTDGSLVMNGSDWAFDFNDSIQFNGSVYHYSPISTYAYCYVPGLDVLIVLVLLCTVFLGGLFAMRLYYFTRGDAN